MRSEQEFAQLHMGGNRPDKLHMGGNRPDKLLEKRLDLDSVVIMQRWSGRQISSQQAVFFCDKRHCIAYDMKFTIEWIMGTWYYQVGSTHGIAE